MKTKAHPAETFGHLLYTIRLGLMKRAQRLLADQGFAITFTHFRLQILPLVCDVTAAPQVMETGTTWFLLSSVNSIALPAPIKKLLSSLI